MDATPPRMHPLGHRNHPLQSLRKRPQKLVLVHGLAARSDTWTDLVPLFPFRQIHSLSRGPPRLRGVVQALHADYSIRAHARRLLQFLEQEGLSGVTLVGHSLGGAVVLLAAIEAMQGGKTALVGSVVVMAGPGFIQRLPLMAEIFRLPLAGWLFVALYAPVPWVKIGLRMAYYDLGSSTGSMWPATPPATGTGTRRDRWWRPAAGSSLPTGTRSPPATAS